MTRGSGPPPAPLPADAPFAAKARAFAELHADGRTGIANLHARVEAVAVGGTVLPALVNDGDAGSAWIGSPRHTYAGYAAEEAARYFPRAAAPAAGAGRVLDRWLARAGIDRAVSVNHWLLSTSLYPPVATLPLAALVAHVRERWPTHATWFRSLAATRDAAWIAALDALGFRRLASRQVYLFDDVDTLARRHGDLRRDLRLLDDGRFARVGDADVRDADYERMAALYTQLYLGRYSLRSPAYDAAFLRRWHRAGLLQLHGMRDGDGRIACFAALFRQGDVLTAPLVGHDLSRPTRAALYRRLNACVFDAARRDGLRLHLSAGAAAFKRHRGGVPDIEYSLVDARAQPPRHRRALAMLGFATARVGVPLVRRYGL